MPKSQISILGCGWLGFPLAQHLVDFGFSVNGSTTTLSKLNALEERGIKPFLLNCCTDGLLQLEDVGFFDAEQLIITLPFKRSFLDPADYSRQFSEILKYIKQSPLKRVVFTSTTSIYKCLGSVVDEESLIDETSERACILNEVEQSILQLTNVDSIVLRLAGLYGPLREIGSFLKRNIQLAGQNNPVNLVSLQDCIRAIRIIIDADQVDGIFNLCSDDHPTKYDLYLKASELYKLPKPQFKSSNTLSKVVSNQKFKHTFHFTFDPLPV